MKRTKSRVRKLRSEARRWSEGAIDPREWQNSPDAIPRIGETKMVSLRMPLHLLLIVQEFAKREGVGYQALIKKWLDDRVRAEAERLRGLRTE